MEKPEPTREELINQIADVVGKVKPLPSLRSQIVSVTSSILIRIVSLSYSAYLAMLFNHRFMGPEPISKATPLGTLDLFLIIGAGSLLSYFVFRKVAIDRFTPVKDFLKPIGVRFAKIILAAAFYMWAFGASSTLESSEALVLLGTLLILNTGYDFRLTMPAPRPTPSHDV